MFDCLQYEDHSGSVRKAWRGRNRLFRKTYTFHKVTVIPGQVKKLTFTPRGAMKLKISDFKGPFVCLYMKTKTIGFRSLDICLFEELLKLKMSIKR